MDSKVEMALASKLGWDQLLYRCQGDVGSAKVPEIVQWFSMHIIRVENILVEMTFLFLAPLSISDAQ